MANVFNVATYFIQLAHSNLDNQITNLKLQKLVYYSQAWSMVFRHQPMFSDQIEAWRRGPVVPNLWEKYADYRNSTIPKPSESEEIDLVFTGEEKCVLDLVWNRYGRLSAIELSELTHKEFPWCYARRGIGENARSQQPILLEDMESYYTNFVETNNYQAVGISSTAILEDKNEEMENTIALTDGDGKTDFVDINKIREYFESQGETRAYIKKTPRRPFTGI